MADLPFRSQAASSAGPGSSGDNSHLPPEQDIDGVNGRAPGGRWPQDDLPMRSNSAPGWSDGFSPSPDNPPLPTDHTDGVGLPPNGTRR
jgi:hypothetical protein